MDALSSQTARPKSRHSGSKGVRMFCHSITRSPVFNALLRITGTKGSEDHCDGVTGCPS